MATSPLNEAVEAVDLLDAFRFETRREDDRAFRPPVARFFVGGAFSLVSATVASLVSPRVDMVGRSAALAFCTTLLLVRVALRLGAGTRTIDAGSLTWWREELLSSSSSLFLFRPLFAFTGCSTKTSKPLSSGSASSCISTSLVGLAFVFFPPIFLPPLLPFPPFFPDFAFIDMSVLHVKPLSSSISATCSLDGISDPILTIDKADAREPFDERDPFTERLGLEDNSMKGQFGDRRRCSSLPIYSATNKASA